MSSFYDVPIWDIFHKLDIMPPRLSLDGIAHMWWMKRLIGDKYEQYLIEQAHAGNTPDASVVLALGISAEK